MRPVVVPVSDVNSETAVIADWHVPDRSPVYRDQIIAEVETSKTILDVAAPEEGYVLHAAPQGAEVRLTEAIAWIFPDLYALERHAVDLRAQPVSSGRFEKGSVSASSAAVRRAAELGVDMESLSTEGLVTVRMVEKAAAPAQVRSGDLPEPLEPQADGERVIIIGAGLGATQVLDVFAAGEAQQAVGIVDDDARRWGDEVGDVPIVGGFPRLESLFADRRFDTAVISISTSIPARTRFRELCSNAGIPLTNAIDRTVRTASDVRMGRGNVVCAFCHFGAGTEIGDNNFISAYNSFDHHNRVGSDTSTGPGCQTSGLVSIGDRVRLGTGIFVEPHVELGEDVQVASGAIIVRSVPPAHVVKRRVVTTITVPLG